MSEDDEIVGNPYFLLDPYREFLDSEGIPVVEAYAVNCLEMDLEPWPRVGGRGAYVHLAGRGDFTSCFVVEIPAGGQLNPERHLFDKTYYVFQGRGSTSIELADGGRRSFEWGPGSMFAIPLNARHELFNGSGSEPARLAACTNLPIYINLINDREFIFDNPYHFGNRFGDDRYFRGEGEFRKVRPGRHQWETNFVPDILGFELPEWQERGAGGRNIMFELGDNPMHIHLSEFPVGTYKKAHRHNSGAHIFIVTGQGYSNLWLEGQSPVDTIHQPWKVGSLFAPPDGPTYHQHFNTAQTPSRYLVMTGTGSARYPVWESRRKTEAFRVTDRSIKEGGNQVEYEFEDPRVVEMYERECAKYGVQSKMRGLIEAAKQKAGFATATA